MITEWLLHMGTNTIYPHSINCKLLHNFVTQLMFVIYQINHNSIHHFNHIIIIIITIIDFNYATILWAVLGKNKDYSCFGNISFILNPHGSTTHIRFRNSTNTFAIHGKALFTFQWHHLAELWMAYNLRWYSLPYIRLK